MKLNVDQLAREFSEDFPVKVSNKEAKLAIQKMFDLITENLAQGHEVNIPDFGKFKVADKPERQGRNPKTGETMTIAAKRVFKFTPAKYLKEKLA